MSEQIVTGTFAVARFRPDNVVLVCRVYPDHETEGKRLCDVKSPHDGFRLLNVPAEAFERLPEGVSLYQVGLPVDGEIEVAATVAGAHGVLVWLSDNETEAADAHVRRVNRTEHVLIPATFWTPVASILNPIPEVEQVTQ